MKSVLVLGGGGFIGRNIVEFLLKRGDCKVTAADIKEGSNWQRLLKENEGNSNFRFVQADFTDAKSFDRIPDEYDDIYMLAAIVGVNRTLQFPHEVIATNTALTMNTIQWLRSKKKSRVLFASSSENYAGTSDIFDVEIPTSEDVPLTISDITHPRWTYAISKIHGEAAFYHSSRDAGFECTIVRYQNIIGPDMGFGHAIPHIVERFVKGADLPFKIYGHNQTRAFCYIDDAVNGTVRAMETENAKNQTYHIGAQDEVSMEELTTFIGDLLGYSQDYEYGITYPGSVSRRCPNIQKAKDQLGYNPRFSWKDAVVKTTEWYKDFFENGGEPSIGGFEPPEKFLINEK